MAVEMEKSRWTDPPQTNIFEGENICDCKTSTRGRSCLVSDHFVHMIQQRSLRQQQVWNKTTFPEEKDERL